MSAWGDDREVVALDIRMGCPYCPPRPQPRKIGPIDCATGEHVVSDPGVVDRQLRWTMTNSECEKGFGKSVPDLVASGLQILFVGINPSICSGAAGLHFASPGNRFWPTLHRAGFTDRQLRPDERGALIARGIGITNLVNRATRRADEVNDDELVAGVERLRRLVAVAQPEAVAVLGRGAYQTGFGRRARAVGRQPEGLDGSALWVLPNPSGLNAHYTVDRLAEVYSLLRASVDR